MCSAKIFFAIIFNEIKRHVNTSLSLVGGNASPLQSQSNFYKISEFLMDKPSSFAHKK